HVALNRAVGGQPVPRWFGEGLAIYHAEEYGIERMRTLWEGTLRKQLRPLSELSGAFPSRPHQVNVAYAQSADFVGYLRRGDGDPRRFQRLIHRLRAGMDFEAAVDDVFGVPLRSLELSWRDELTERYGVFPLLVSGGALWVG